MENTGRMSIEEGERAFYCMLITPLSKVIAVRSYVRAKQFQHNKREHNLINLPKNMSTMHTHMLGRGESTIKVYNHGKQKKLFFSP
jgi:hypothetical protein